MKTGLATLIVALAAPISVTAAPRLPDAVLSEIIQDCNEDVAGDSQATQSMENCIATAVQTYKKANP